MSFYYAPIYLRTFDLLGSALELIVQIRLDLLNGTKTFSIEMLPSFLSFNI